MGAAVWIPYRVIRARRPAPEESFGEIPRLRPADGLAFFCAGMVVFLLTAPYLHSTYGLWGLLATQLMILLPALMIPFLTRTRPTDLFQLRFPSARHTFGGILLWAGALLGAKIGTSLLLSVFPGLASDMEQVGAFLSSGDLILQLFAAVLVPAVCEEFLHRGVLLASFRGRYNDAFTVVTLGLIFGLFHMDPARFLLTALLGMAMTYAALRSRSILLPILLHFMNNLLAVSENVLAGDSEPAALGAEAAEALFMLLSQGLIAVFALALLTAGYLLLRDNRHHRPGRRNPMVIAAAALAITLAAQSVVVVVRLW